MTTLLPNKSLNRLVLPSGKTLAFHCEGTRRYRNLVLAAGQWTVGSNEVRDHQEFASFEGGGPAWIACYAQAAQIAIVQRNDRLRLRSTRMTAGFNVAAFLAKAFASSVRGHDTQCDIGPQLFGIAGQLVYDELATLGNHESGIRVTEAATGIGVPLEAEGVSPAAPS
jgi:hypothetical protein